MIGFAERHAWVLLLIVGVASLAIGIGDYGLQQGGDTDMVESVTGMSWPQLQAANPRVADLVDLLARVLGAWLIGFSLLSIAITATAFRRGQRWAWYAMWSLPLVLALVFVAFLAADRVPDDPAPPGRVSAPALMVISAVGLLLPIRVFFDERRRTAPETANR